MENKKVIWWGSNGKMRNQMTPVEVNILEMFKEL
jgi:hypothetical protein